MSSSAKDPVAAARRLYLAGDVSRAEVICRQVLAQSQNNDAAWQLMGVLALDAHKDDLAVRLFMRALDIAPGKPPYYVNLAVGLHRLGKPKEAADALRLAISLQPQLAEAHFNLSRCLTDLAEHEQAFTAIEQAATLAPDSFEIQRHWARVRKLRGEIAPAIDAYRRALALDPKSLECLIEICSLLRASRLGSEALALAERAVALDPQSASALNEWGLSLLLEDKPDAALEVLSRALERERSAEILCSLGYAYETVGLLEESILKFREALELDPTLYQAHSNVIFLQQFVPGVEPPAILAETRRWDINYATALRSDWEPHPNLREPERKLKVGYVSAHFYSHCQSFFTTPLFQNHDRSRFEVHAYSCVDRSDDTTAKLRGAVDVWHETSQLDPAALARAIRGDAMDILVDLAMHMGSSRLLTFARKPAPVQVSWLAYPGTTGLSAIDYRITDRFLDPTGRDFSQYSERSVIMPDTFWCYDPLSADTEVGDLPALHNGYVTFGCLNHFRKINEPLLDLWAEVLKRVGGSRLLMHAPEGGVRDRIRRQFTEHGIEPARLSFVGRYPRPEYLELYRQIDLCLDSHPYGGHTTSMDAFWRGVPVVSLVGPLVVGRAAVTIAMNLGLEQFVTYDPEQFVAAAVGLSTDLKFLSSIRAGLTQRMRSSLLMNGKRFARLLESGYRRVWRDWCGGICDASRPLILEFEPD